MNGYKVTFEGTTKSGKTFQGSCKIETGITSLDEVHDVLKTAQVAEIRFIGFEKSLDCHKINELLDLIKTL